MSDDLWATEPAAAPAQHAPAAYAAPPQAAYAPIAESKPSALFRLTLKEDGPPWLTVEADSTADLAAVLGDKEGLGAVLKRASQVSVYWRGQGGQHAAQNAHQPTQQAAPAPQSYGVPGPQTAPGGERRFCPHGEMPYKAGVSRKTGKPYAMWVCSHPDRAQQCKPQNPGDPVPQAPAAAGYDAPPF